MLELLFIADPRVRETVELQMREIGQEAAHGYAQRVVGQPETGSLTPANCELINACNPDNFLRCYGNIVRVHGLKVAQDEASKKG